MKIIAENPDEDILLTKLEETIKNNGYQNVFTETFTQSFLGQIVNAELSDVCPDRIKEWSPSQRLWFYDACKDFFKRPEFLKIKEEYINLFKVYDLLFKEEQTAQQKAVEDFSLFQDIQKSCSILHVDNYKKLKTYLDKGIVKGKDGDIRNVSAFYDESLSQYVIELNSIKVPFTYKRGKIQEEFVVYGWSDSERKYSYEFLKPELLAQNIKKDALDDRIAEASVKKSENIKENRKLQETGRSK